jgi:SAM-dependent methyltransferase
MKAPAWLKAGPAARAARGVADWVDLYSGQQRRRLRQYARFAHGRLLDVGCGNKPFEAYFRPYVDSYVGVEHEGSFAITDASSRASKPDHFYDGRRLPFDDASFDTVLNVDVLEHTPSPQHLVSEMGRVLKDGGTLILTAPFSFRLHELPHDYFRYTPNGLRELCARAHISVTEVAPIGSLWSLVGHKINSFFAFRVAHLDGLGQALQKLGHEATTSRRPRVWTLPAVGPAMLGVTGAARVLDRFFPDATEALGHLIVGVRQNRMPERG